MTHFYDHKSDYKSWNGRPKRTVSISSLETFSGTCLDLVSNWKILSRSTTSAEPLLVSEIFQLSGVVVRHIQFYICGAFSILQITD